MRAFLLILLCAATMAAADISGTWIGALPNQQANAHRIKVTQQVALQLVQNGTTISGKLYGDYESSPIIEGKIDGSSVDFVVVAQEQQGNQINQTRLHFTGTVQSDGTIELSRVRESSTNAGNGGAYKSQKSGTKQTFVIKRIT
jgi:hypothetical protein